MYEFLCSYYAVSLYLKLLNETCLPETVALIMG